MYWSNSYSVSVFEDDKKFRMDSEIKMFKGPKDLKKKSAQLLFRSFGTKLIAFNLVVVWNWNILDSQSTKALELWDKYYWTLLMAHIMNNSTEGKDYHLKDFLQF